MFVGVSLAFKKLLVEGGGGGGGLSAPPSFVILQICVVVKVPLLAPIT